MNAFILGLLLFASNSLAAESYGIFMVVKGTVSVKSKDGATVAAKVSSKVVPGDTVISGPDSRGKIVMSDRNVINVSSDTTLIIKDYRNDPVAGVKNVELELIAGKVRNNVEQTYDGEKSKFQVKTPTAVAGVRGTQFFTSFNPTTQLTSIVTLKGSVTLASVNSAGKIIGTPVVIQRGQTSTSSPGAPPPPPVSVPKEDLKRIEFDNPPTPPGKTENPASDKKEPNQKGPNNTTDNPPKKDNPNSRDVASERPKNPPPPPTMIDKGDMNSDIARDIKNPIPPSSPVTNLPDRINAPTAPRNPVNPNVTDIIRNNNQRSNLIVIPKTK